MTYEEACTAIGYATPPVTNDEHGHVWLVTVVEDLIARRGMADPTGPEEAQIRMIFNSTLVVDPSRKGIR
jgi:hypothetical protein